MKACDLFLFSLIGRDSGTNYNLNQTRLDLYTTHTPAGTSVQNFVHWIQEMRSGKFGKFDYGLVGNLERYGSLHAPQYDVSNINVPMAIISGAQDALADPYDVHYFLGKLQQSGNKNVIFYKEIPPYVMIFIMRRL